MIFSNYIAVIFPLFATFFQLVAATPTWHTASDGKSYLIESDRKYNWLQANDLCARLDLQLVVIDNAEKNAAFDSLLRGIFGQSTELWLGHHDEFNKAEITGRPFYSVSKGDKISFNNWKTNEPNNAFNVRYSEHCVHIYNNADFKWNDARCENRLIGYVCEEHHLTDKYRKNLEQKRLEAYKRTNQLASELADTQKEINSVIANSLNDTDGAFLKLQKSTAEIVAKSKKAIDDVIEKKPYLQAVIADVGDEIREIFLKAHDEISQANDEARQLIADVYVRTTKVVDDVVTGYSNKFSENTKDIEQLLVI